jgi:hypothetical protein
MHKIQKFMQIPPDMIQHYDHNAKCRLALPQNKTFSSYRRNEYHLHDREKHSSASQSAKMQSHHHCEKKKMDVPFPFLGKRSPIKVPESSSFMLFLGKFDVNLNYQSRDFSLLQR